MAMGIISKEKKEIRWCGLPSKQESMREDARRRRDRAAVDVRRKRRHLQELLTQHASLQNLAKLNKRRGLEAKNSKDLMDEDGGDAEANATLALPFIVVATPASTTVRCEVTDDRREVFFDFSAPFEIRDDGDVLRGLGLHRGMPNIQRAPPKLPFLVGGRRFGETHTSEGRRQGRGDPGRVSARTGGSAAARGGESASS